MEIFSVSKRITLRHKWNIYLAEMVSHPKLLFFNLPMLYSDNLWGFIDLTEFN